MTRISGEDKEKKKGEEKNIGETPSFLLHRNVLPCLKALVTPLITPPKKHVLGRERKSHALQEHTDCLHMMV